MRGFLLFGFSDWYPSGGCKDLLGAFVTQEDALAWAKEEVINDRGVKVQYHCLDIETSRIVFEFFQNTDTYKWQVRFCSFELPAQLYDWDMRRGF